jgi:hypothetical protein
MISVRMSLGRRQAFSASGALLTFLLHNSYELLTRRRHISNGARDIFFEAPVQTNRGAKVRHGGVGMVALLSFLLGLTNGYTVLKMVVDADSWTAHRRLDEMDLPEKGVTVLAIQRAGGAFVGAHRQVAQDQDTREHSWRLRLRNHYARHATAAIPWIQTREKSSSHRPTRTIANHKGTLPLLTRTGELSAGVAGSAAWGEYTEQKGGRSRATPATPATPQGE